MPRFENSLRPSQRPEFSPGWNARAVVVFVALLCGAVSPQVGGQALPSDDQCQLIRHGALLTMDGTQENQPTANQDVLVCGQFIKAIGPSGTIEPPAGSETIDATGKVVMPGLFDGHVHLMTPLDLELNLAWGVTGVRNLFGSTMSLGMRERLNKGELWGPRLWTAGPIVDGDPAIWPGSDAVATAAAAREAVENQVKAGYDFIKVYSLLKPEAFHAAVAAAKKAGVPVGGHVPMSVPLDEAVKAGMNFIEHLQEFLPAMQGADAPMSQMRSEELAELGFSDRSRLSAEGFDPARLPEVAKLMVENGVWNIPTFLVLERISASQEQKQEWLKNHPQMRTVSAMSENFWNPANDFRLRNMTPEQLAARQRAARLHYPVVKALHDAGAELMLGTDTPNPFVFPGYSVHEELQRFVTAGLSPLEALRTATVQPARFLGQEAVFGKVKVGMEADLLILDANPLDDINNTQKIFGVVSRGRWLDRTAIDAKLDAVAKAYGKE